MTTKLRPQTDTIHDLPKDSTVNSVGDFLKEIIGIVSRDE